MSEPSELAICRQQTSFDVTRLSALLDPEGRLRMKSDLLQVMSKEPAFDKRKKSAVSVVWTQQHGDRL